MPKAIKKKSAKKEHSAEIEVQDRIKGIKTVFEKKQKTLAAYGLVALSAAMVIGVSPFTGSMPTTRRSSLSMRHIKPITTYTRRPDCRARKGSEGS